MIWPQAPSNRMAEPQLETESLIPACILLSRFSKMKKDVRLMVHMGGVQVCRCAGEGGLAKRECSYSILGSFTLLLIVFASQPKRTLIILQLMAYRQGRLL